MASVYRSVRPMTDGFGLHNSTRKPYGDRLLKTLRRTSLEHCKDTLGLINRLRYRGNRFECTLCGARLRTMLSFEHGSVRRKHVLCPVCRSLDRHRFLWHIVERKQIISVAPCRTLHVAPEWAVCKRLRACSEVDYLSVDLVDDTRAMALMDITDTGLAERSVDLIVCSHVLEHVPNDRKAILELHRILSLRGRLLIQVPLSDSERTLEDPAIQSPQDRRRYYRQEDHVRLYGNDLADRLRQGGFAVTVYDPKSECSPEQIERWRLDDGQWSLSGCRLFVCAKAPIAAA